VQVEGRAALWLAWASARRTMSAFLHWGTQIVILASMTAGERYRHSQWKLVFAVFEPLAIVCLVSFGQSYVFNTMPAFGTSTFLFNATGFIPYYLFIHVSQKSVLLDAMRMIPHTTWIDRALAYLLGELLVKMTILAIIFIGLFELGVPDALPANPIGCIPPLLLIAGMGFAVGLLNLVIMSFWESWYYIYVLLVRALMSVSGVLYVMDLVPLQVRTITVYNPIAQAITWFRSNVYNGYPVYSLDVAYAVQFAAIMLFVALLLEDATREWRNIR
jgi:capsular polysaccharide transport system permease protein